MEKIFEGEYRFLCILWENEPIVSPKLVQLCNEQLGWKNDELDQIPQSFQNTNDELNQIQQSAQMTGNVQQ